MYYNRKVTIGNGGVQVIEFIQSAIDRMLNLPERIWKRFLSKFNKDSSPGYTDIVKFVDMIIERGTSETVSGQFILGYDLLSNYVSLGQFRSILPQLVDELRTRQEVGEVMESSIVNDGSVIDIQFYGSYCPNYEKLEGED